MCVFVYVYIEGENKFADRLSIAWFLVKE